MSECPPDTAQATFLARVSERNTRFAAIERRFIERGRRMARIEDIRGEHSDILAEHSRMLPSLPERVQEKIGFNALEPSLEK